AASHDTVLPRRSVAVPHRPSEMQWRAVVASVGPVRVAPQYSVGPSMRLDQRSAGGGSGSTGGGVAVQDRTARASSILISRVIFEHSWRASRDTRRTGEAFNGASERASAPRATTTRGRTR